MPVLIRLFRRRRTKAEAQTQQTPQTTTETVEPATEPAAQEPAPEESMESDPPPYSAPPSARHDHTTSQDSSQESVGGAPTTTDLRLLDPNLQLSAALMEQQWLERDRIFARAVVQFIAERFDGNLKGWAGYKYTHISENENPPRKESAWDGLVGYNAWSYRGRFRQVSALAKRDFERRGFDVRKCEVYTSQDGIYVHWSLDTKKNWK